MKNLDSRERLKTGIDSAEHLTVEVRSTGELNEPRDREVKLKLYSRHSAQDYWAISWHLKSSEVYRRIEAQLQLVGILIEGDTLTSPLLSGFSTLHIEIFQ